LYRNQIKGIVIIIGGLIAALAGYSYIKLGVYYKDEGAISFGAIVAIPFEDIINNKEYALASGVDKVLGHWGTDLVVAGAFLATSSAISGTVFGASRQMSVIAKDGCFLAILAEQTNHIPVYSIITMAGLVFSMVLAGSLQVILEFASVTFLLASLLMAYANYKIRHLTDSSAVLTILSLFGLMIGTVSILYHEISTQVQQIVFIGGIYVLLTFGSLLYSRKIK